MWLLNFLAGAQGIAPLVLRLVLGWVFFAVHGLHKVAPKTGFDWGASFVKESGDAAPAVMLYAAAWTEFLGGFLILIGLLTRWSALAIACVMGYAFLKVHAGDVFGVREKSFAYAGAAVALLFMGPGKVSLDRLFFGPEALEPKP